MKLSAALVVCVLWVGLAFATDQPNVIIVMTDDQGYGDLSCHGNPVLETPNIDKLHEQSVRFTDFHVDPTCAPTRAALLTGKYSHHVKVWHTIAGGNHLRASEKTMADLFKASGYRTGLFGKWHLGANYPYRPIDQGFSEWLGHGDGGTGTTDDWFDNDRVNDMYWHNGKRVKREGYAPDVFFAEAIKFIETSGDKPFFVYLATYLPHDPHTVPDRAMLEKYKGKVSDYVGAYFAGIDRIDWNIGRLREALEGAQVEDNTILIFMTDNGSVAGWKLFNAGMRGHKCDAYEGGHRVPFFIHWPNGGLKHGKDVNDLTAHIDVLPTLVELCGLDAGSITFDGRSFSDQLHNPELLLPERTLFVENQRTFVATPWETTAGMTRRWRLIDNIELYDIQKDPSQTNNVINDFPEIAERIRGEFSSYWKTVTPGDRDEARPIVGSPADPETYLTPSDWYLPDVPWNHAQVAAGSPLSGSWEIAIAEDGLYRFEVRRWPREAKAPIRGVPDFENKTVDAWNAWGGIDRLIYGRELKALPVESIKLQVGGFSESRPVAPSDEYLIFDVPLQKGNLSVTGTLHDADGRLIAGTYYVYVMKL